MKKDKVLSQYYKDLLQLEETLNDVSLIKSDVPESIWNAIFVESHLNSKARNISAQYGAKKQHDDIFCSLRKKNFITVASCGLFVVISLSILLRLSNKQSEMATIYETATKTPIAKNNENAFACSSEVVLSPQDVIPSALQEVFRPALVPLRETYESGKQTVLDDLGSLPLQPISDLRNFLYAKYETPLSFILQSNANSSEVSTKSDSFFIDLLLNADYWFSTNDQD
ncbi:MAG: hypothetical protein LBJ67_18685 [Planctomycetaceae bacterium]|nr:hypothetical protein [Planctomycetaceae bacterium]